MSQTTDTPSQTGAKGQTHTIPSGSKELVKKKDAELLYDPVSQEFVLVHPADFGELKKDIDAFEAFKPYMKVFFSEEKGKEKEQAAEIKAVLEIIKKFIDATTEADGEKIIKELPKLIEEKKKENLLSGNVAQGNKMKDGDIKEYLWATGSETARLTRLVRIRTKKTKKYWKTWKFDAKNYNRELKREKDKKEKEEEEKEKKNKDANALVKFVSKMEKEAESKLFEKKLLEKSDQFATLVNKNFFEDCDQLDAGISSQFLRYSAEAAVESVVDWKAHKVKIAGKAEGSASLIQGKGHFTVYLPENNGLDIWGSLRKIDPKLVKANAKPLFLMLKLNVEGSAFVGVCASLGFEAGVCAGEKGKKDSASAGTQASLDLFAGAKASAELSAAGLMKLVSDKEVVQNAEWSVLGSVTWGAYAAVGLGLTAGFKVGYYEGKFEYEAKIGVVVKLGAGTSVKGAVDPLKIGQFLYTVATSVDWLYLSDIFEGKVHNLFQSIMANCLYTEKAIEDVVKEMKDHIPQMMGATAEVLEEKLSILKQVDDTFDHYIPGYSGFKKFRAEFWILKTTYHSLRNLNQEKELADNAVMQTNFIEQAKRWKYATWQMKVNLITDMMQSGLFSKYSQSEKQKAMLSVFRSARNSAEFKKMYLCITGADALFSDDRKTQFDQLKAQFK